MCRVQFSRLLQFYRSDSANLPRFSAAPSWFVTSLWNLLQIIFWRKTPPSFFSILILEHLWNIFMLYIWNCSPFLTLNNAQFLCSLFIIDAKHANAECGAGELLFCSEISIFNSVSAAWWACNQTDETCNKSNWFPLFLYTVWTPPPPSVFHFFPQIYLKDSFVLPTCLDCKLRPKSRSASTLIQSSMLFIVSFFFFFLVNNVLINTFFRGEMMFC